MCDRWVWVGATGVLGLAAGACVPPQVTEGLGAPPVSGAVTWGVGCVPGTSPPGSRHLEKLDCEMSLSWLTPDGFLQVN